MSQSLVKIYLHIIFSTKDRENILPKSLLTDVHAYISGVIKNNGCVPIITGGITNHVHILCELSSTITVSDLVRKIKTSTSIWLKENNMCDNRFSWQGGYAAFSVSQSQVDTVMAYIANQEQHHQKRTFKEELTAFLEKYNVKYDNQHLWT